jgi:hypothetical protein
MAIIVAAIDLIARLLIIERKDAIKHGYDPAGTAQEDTKDSSPANGSIQAVEKPQEGDSTDNPVSAQPVQLLEAPRLDLIGVFGKLAKSSRTLPAMFCILVYGWV